MGAFQFGFRLTGGGVPPILSVRVAASQTIKAGDILTISSGKASKAGQAPTADTVLGVAVEDKTTDGSPTDADQVRYIPALPDIIWRAVYTGSSKTSLGDADRDGTAFDIDATSHKVNLDDTTGGWLYVHGFNNTDKVALVRMDPAKLYLV